MKTVLPVGIVAIGAYAPPGIMTNFDLEKIVDTSDEWIRTRSGISTRHIAEPSVATSDIAYEGALLALQRANLAVEDVDLIIVATLTPDAPLPSTACLVQHKLGAMRAAAFDVSAACSGFIYALNVGSAMVATGQYRNALVIGVDLLSRVTDYTDRGTCVLLGDGGGAVVLQPVEEGRGFLSIYLRADGSGSDLLSIPAGGSRLPSSLETVENRQHFLRMNGAEVYRFAVRVIEESVTTALAQAGMTTDDVALVIPHQANIRIIEAAAKRLGIGLDRWANNIRDYGNTSAGSIPLALNEAYETGRVHPGDVIVMVGFGGGLTWGATVLRW
ncbi:MAG TPA: beta-ketoacyl-ACP synthase III [Armatimonadota bacterium]|jgi:3-oxoacyl-[acyl-carrier-protein] synthase-3